MQTVPTFYFRMNQNIQFKDKEKLYENTFFRIQNVSPQVIQHFVSAVVSLKLVLIHHVAVRYRPHLNMSGLNISCSQWGEHYLTLCILRLVFAYKWELRLLSCCSSTETFQIKIWAAEQLSGTTQGRTDRRSLNIKESWKTQKTMRWGGRGRQSHSAANGKKNSCSNQRIRSQQTSEFIWRVSDGCESAVKLFCRYLWMSVRQSLWFRVK